MIMFLAKFSPEKTKFVFITLTIPKKISKKCNDFKNINLVLSVTFPIKGDNHISVKVYILLTIKWPSMCHMTSAPMT